MRTNKIKWTQEQGVIAVEATMALVVFIFAISFLLNIANVAMAHAVVQNALSQTAKEISELSYLYAKAGLFSLEDNLNGYTQKQKETEKNISNQIENMQNFDVENTLDALGSLLSAVDGSKNTAGQSFNDIQEMLTNFGYDAMNEGLTEVKSKIAVPALCKILIPKYLTAQGSREAADAKLSGLNIMSEDGNRIGLNAMDFSKSSLFDDEEGRGISIVVTYPIRNFIPFLNIKKTEYQQAAVTRAWAGDQ